jgi:hypothetical protein
MSCERTSSGVFLIIFAATSVCAQAPSKELPNLAGPSKSLPPSGGASRVTRSFPAQRIKTVILRAGGAEKAEVGAVAGARLVTVSGTPAGGAAGYHPADPNWWETPASEWGLDFLAKVFGSTLVISSRAEISYIHHDYHLDRIRITVPEGVKVIKENRKLTGDPSPDLSAPDAR